MFTESESILQRLTKASFRQTIKISAHISSIDRPIYLLLKYLNSGLAIAYVYSSRNNCSAYINDAVSTPLLDYANFYNCEIDMPMPVASKLPNGFGIYDMIGNVWEITSDLFNVNHYKELDLNKSIKNPKGASSCYNPSNPYELQYIMKGGSFLCHDSYCASYRISARMG